MARRRLNQTELATAIGRSQSYVSRRVTGEFAFDLDDLERIAAALGVAYDRLLPTVDTRQYHRSTLVLAA